MPFYDITAKLGNMRKAAEFTIYPPDKSPPETITIQSDNRIATVRLSDGKGILSDGKGGHQGHWKLLRGMGNMIFQMPDDVLADLRAKVSKMSPGPVVIGAIKHES